MQFQNALSQQEIEKRQRGGYILEEQIISGYIRAKKVEVCDMVDRILEELKNPERISNAPVNQLSSVMGTLLDKFGADEKQEEAEGTLNEIFGEFEDVK